MRKTGFLVSGLMAALGCATAAVEPATGPAPAPPPAASSAPTAGLVPAVLRADAPPATGRADEELVLDHRGAFGPLLVDQFAIDLDRSGGRCLLLPVRPSAEKPTVERESAIDGPTALRLRTLAQALIAQPPHDVRRRFLIHDLGTVTLTVRDRGREVTLTVDGGRTLDPYPQELLALLQQLRAQCEGAAAAATVPVSAPAAVGN
ncbi:MAG: hypothetical protein JXR83_03285 [Deltaproteobacteria bacterium]|nr:hypothetical protein [Deltaproteobacteria bacterium]